MRMEDLQGFIRKPRTGHIHSAKDATRATRSIRFASAPGSSGRLPRFGRPARHMRPSSFAEHPEPGPEYNNATRPAALAERLWIAGQMSRFDSSKGKMGNWQADGLISQPLDNHLIQALL
ncbi:unnamed protein product [Protopolystoma xenopodis]|uniref:Uncharacterized protein n=1 Tax=Protopolystoma xenopodis TaxID=117903 RepID=A0A3S5C0V4_9PLAT|nr:unnamed protein product [Protopolystoma xenopodis]